MTITNLFKADTLKKEEKKIYAIMKTVDYLMITEVVERMISNNRTYEIAIEHKKFQAS